jgi:hypothetical protein
MMITLLLSCWFAIFPVSDVQSIQDLFATKQHAVNTGDLSMYLSTIYTDNHYRQEQKRWFLDAVSYIDSNSFRLKVTNLKRISKDRYQVKVVQSYRKNNKQYIFRYPVDVKKSKKSWKDTDSLSFEMRSGHIVIKYSDPNLKEQAKRAIGILSRVSKVLGSKYNWYPSVMEAKLYQEPELFRQSVKLSLPTWAGGWNEAKQSIKLVVSEEDKASLIHGLAHEYTHQLVSDLTNDNASYWLQEGAAMYYESLVTGEEPLLNKQFKPYSIVQLEKMNLEQLPDSEASRYYLSCYVQFRQLVQKFGEKTIANIFRKLHHYPYIDVDSAMKQKETNQRTYNILVENKILPRKANRFDDAYINRVTDKKIL